VARKTYPLLFFVACLGLPTSVIFPWQSVQAASPSLLGQSGLISMPDARLGEEGSLNIGYSFYKPYPTFWSSISLFPRFEFSARYTRVMYVTAFAGQGYGDYKDKAFDAKLQLLSESEYLPAVAVGVHDFLGTQLLSAGYISLSKQFGPVDVSLGYGEQRLDGWFGGVRYTPEWAKNVSVVAEYDAFDYKNDRYAIRSGAVNKAGGATLGLEYRWGWLGSQLSYQDGDWGINAHISIPLQQKEFVPKIHEPKVYTEVVPRSPTQQWQENKQDARQLVTALEEQGYKNVKLGLNGHQLNLSFSQPRITLVGRAIGRAARTAMLLAPTDATSIKLTYYTITDLPLVSYHFKDLEQLQRFFAGQVTYGELLKNLEVTYAETDYVDQFQAHIWDLPAADEVNRDAAGKDADKNTGDPGPDSDRVNEGEVGVEPSRSGTSLLGFKLKHNEDGHSISLSRQDKALSQYKIVPFNFGLFFNDPSGALRYDTFAKFYGKKYLGQGLFLEGALRLQMFEDVSGVTQASNSLLPHVRSDVADYKRERGLKINNLALNQYWLLRPRLYARVSLGLYEEMFGGAGGQILYLPKQGSWAADLSVDWLRQRDTDGEFGFRQYETVTAVGALHYQIKKYGVTTTLRAGRFLAKDSGARLEFSRRFHSGIRVGMWYTRTDGNDITGPGNPGSPYYDKGIMMTIPFGNMLTKDTRANAGFALSPWTRDVGQMVKSPGDLYQILEEPLLLDRPGHHLLSDFHY